MEKATMKQFNAPWGVLLWVMSTLATAACLAVAMSPCPVWLRVLAPFGIGGAALFTVRGYRVGADCIWVQRLFWSTRLPLAGLQSVRVPSDEERRSLTVRTFGNGGFFSFTGWYWSKALGTYRAFVTDPKRMVILTFARRTVVLSPDCPDDFIRELSAERNEAVSVLYRGKVKGVIRPAARMSAPSLREHAFFGSCASDEPVESTVERLRGGRYRAL
jgi:hypothetical protein